MFTPSPGKALLSTAAIDPAHAAVVTDGMISIFDHLHDHHPDAFRRCLTADDVTAPWLMVSWRPSSISKAQKP